MRIVWIGWCCNNFCIEFFSHFFWSFRKSNYFCWTDECEIQWIEEKNNVFAFIITKFGWVLNQILFRVGRVLGEIEVKLVWKFVFCSIYGSWWKCTLKLGLVDRPKINRLKGRELSTNRPLSLLSILPRLKSTWAWLQRILHRQQLCNKNLVLVYQSLLLYLQHW